MYQDIKQPEIIKGLKFWKNPGNKLPVLMLHYTADPTKDPGRDGAEWYAKERAGISKQQWNKEYEIDFVTKSGKLIYDRDFCDYDPSLEYNQPHWVDPFEWPEPAELLISLDFGQRNPNCALVAVWTADERLYIIDEYYKANLPSKASQEMFKQFAYLLAPGDEASFLKKTVAEKRSRAINIFGVRVIDPTTFHKNRSAVKMGEEIPYSVAEEFYDNGWDFEPAQNDVDAGITRVREYLGIEPATGKPRLMFFKGRCPNLKAEIENYRYKTLTEVQQKTRDASDEPIKKNDHAMDALKNLLMTRPAKPSIKPPARSRIQKDIDRLTTPKDSDGGWDDDSKPTFY